MSQAHHWTEGEIQRLRKLARTGMYTAPDLAQLLGRSVDSVRSHLRRMGVEPKPIRRRAKEVPQAQRELLAEMAAKGFSVTAMRQKVRLSEERVRRTLAQILGKPYRQPRDAAREGRAAALRGYLTEVPEKVKNDHLKHCLAILRASDGRGFTYGLSPASERIRGQHRSEPGCHIEPLREHPRMFA